MQITALPPTILQRTTHQARTAPVALDRFTPSATPDFVPYGPFLKVGQANTGAALGTGNLRDEMVNAGMTNVSTPPTEAERRTFYTQHAPHHELIANHKYQEAAEKYRNDALQVKNDEPRRKALDARARQLEFAARMKSASFPPTLDEVKTHFKGLKDAKGEFQKYVKAFYGHVQDADRNADVVYDQDQNKGKVQTFTPEDFDDVSNSRGLNANGQRLIDCEGYAFLGQELLGAAGFKQPAKGGFMVMRGNGDEAHVILQMERGQEKLWISNDSAIDDLARAYDSTRAALRLPARSQATFYHGSTERQAVERATVKDPDPKHQTAVVFR